MGCKRSSGVGSVDDVCVGVQKFVFHLRGVREGKGKDAIGFSACSQMSGIIRAQFVVV